MWEVFKDFIFQIIQFFHGSLGDWGMSIIVVTIIFRVLISPLMHKQTKSSYQMQKFQPKIKAIQDKYANDPQRLQEETQKLYAEAHFNPLAGCLPMLFQMPIFIALFQVLNEMGTRIGESDYSFYNIVPDLVISPSIAFPNGFGTFRELQDNTELVGVPGSLLALAAGELAGLITNDWCGPPVPQTNTGGPAEYA